MGTPPQYIVLQSSIKQNRDDARLVAVSPTEQRKPWTNIRTAVGSILNSVGA